MTPKRRPNVIIIVTDDQGYGDMACHGNPHLSTPNLDKLYAESVRLTDYHLDPMCAPSRAALMTGRYSARTGVWSTLTGRYIMRRDENDDSRGLCRVGLSYGIVRQVALGRQLSLSPP
jgi:arylsulfatase A-like enzyme